MAAEKSWPVMTWEEVGLEREREREREKRERRDEMTTLESERGSTSYIARLSLRSLSSLALYSLLLAISESHSTVCVWCVCVCVLVLVFQ